MRSGLLINNGLQQSSQILGGIVCVTTIVSLVYTQAIHAMTLQKKAASSSQVGDPYMLENPGFPSAYFYKPRNTKQQKPVFVYLHGRGAVPKEPCRFWAPVVTEFGWLLCPSGQELRGVDAHNQQEYGWNNDPINSTKNILGALDSLRKKFGRRVQRFGNVLMGFSEGAFIAQRVGPNEVKTFNRWLILASCKRYFENPDRLRSLKPKVKRVALWTGEFDQVADETHGAYQLLKTAGIDVKMRIADHKFHALPEHEMKEQYRSILKWLLAKK